MKKVLMVFLILIFLASLGVGGFFLYKHFATEGSSPVTSDSGPEYQFSKDPKMKEILKEIKEVAGKKQYKEAVESLDNCINIFLLAMPSADSDVIKSLLVMTSYQEVTVEGADQLYTDVLPIYQVCYYDSGYYTINSDDMMLLAGSLLGETDETAAATEVQDTTNILDKPTDELTDEEESSIANGVKEMFNNNPDYGELYQKRLLILHGMLSGNFSGAEIFDTETYTDIQNMLALESGYEASSDAKELTAKLENASDENKAVLADYISGVVNSLATESKLEFVEYRLEGDPTHDMDYDDAFNPSISAVYKVTGVPVKVAEVSFKGDYVNYTDLALKLADTLDWEKYSYGLTSVEDMLVISRIVDWNEQLDGEIVQNLEEVGFSREGVPDMLWDVQTAVMTYYPQYADNIDGYRNKDSWVGCIGQFKTESSDNDIIESGEVNTQEPSGQESQETSEAETETAQDTSDF